MVTDFDTRPFDSCVYQRQEDHTGVVRGDLLPPSLVLILVPTTTPLSSVPCPSRPVQPVSSPTFPPDGTREIRRNFLSPLRSVLWVLMDYKRLARPLSGDVSTRVRGREQGGDVSGDSPVAQEARKGSFVGRVLLTQRPLDPCPGEPRLMRHTGTCTGTERDRSQEVEIVSSHRGPTREAVTTNYRPDTRNTGGVQWRVK